MIEIRDNAKVWPCVDKDDVENYLSENPYRNYLIGTDQVITITSSHGPFVDFSHGVVISDSGVYKLPEVLIDAAPVEANNLSWPDVSTDDLEEFDITGFDLVRIDVNLTTGNLFELYNEHSDSRAFGLGYVLQHSVDQAPVVAPVIYFDNANGDFDPIVRGFSLFKSRSVCQAVHQWLVGSGINFLFSESLSVLKPNIPLDTGIIAFIPKNQRLSFVMTGDVHFSDLSKPELSNMPLEDEHTVGFFVITGETGSSRLIKLSDDAREWTSTPRGAVELKDGNITQSINDLIIEDGEHQTIEQSAVGRIINGIGSLAILLVIYFLIRNK